MDPAKAQPPGAYALVERSRSTYFTAGIAIPFTRRLTAFRAGHGKIRGALKSEEVCPRTCEATPTGGSLVRGPGRSLGDRQIRQRPAVLRTEIRSWCADAKAAHRRRRVPGQAHCGDGAQQATPWGHSRPFDVAAPAPCPGGSGSIPGPDSPRRGLTARSKCISTSTTATARPCASRREAGAPGDPTRGGSSATIACVGGRRP